MRFKVNKTQTADMSSFKILFILFLDFKLYGNKQYGKCKEKLIFKFLFTFPQSNANGKYCKHLKHFEIVSAHLLNCIIYTNLHMPHFLHLNWTTCAKCVVCALCRFFITFNFVSSELVMGLCTPMCAVCCAMCICFVRHMQICTSTCHVLVFYPSSNVIQPKHNIHPGSAKRFASSIASKWRSHFCLSL